MAIKVFILGRPGSGKSTAARFIAMLAQNKDRSSIRINDYEILYNMFRADTTHKKFLSAEHNGFKVIDFSVLDAALKEVEKKARIYIPSMKKDDLIIIEFARNDYRKSLKQFKRDFLRDAYFLFIETDIDTCVRRVYERTAHRTTLDDHFVSDDIIRCHYHNNNKSYIVSNLKTDYGIDGKKVVIIDNTGSWQDFVENINLFVEAIFKQETPILCETDPLQNSSSLVSTSSQSSLNVVARSGDRDGRHSISASQTYLD